MKENYIFEPSGSAIKIMEMKPNYNMTFHNSDKQVGALDFNGPEMTFTGDADESAKVFFDWIAKWFKGRLEQERAEEREACAKLADKVEYRGACESDVARAIRAVGSRAVGNRAYDRYEGDNT